MTKMSSVLGKFFFSPKEPTKKSPQSVLVPYIFQQPWDIISQAFFHICVKYFSNNAKVHTSSKTKANHLFLGPFDKLNLIPVCVHRAAHPALRILESALSLDHK